MQLLSGKGEPADDSDSSGLSPPPNRSLSPPHFATGNTPTSYPGHGVASSTAAKNSTTADKPVPQKRQRKPKEPVDPNAPPKEKKPRAPRQPKDPNAPKPQRKKRKVDEGGPIAVKTETPAPTGSVQQKITDLVNPTPPPAPVQQSQYPPPQPLTHSPTAPYSNPPTQYQHIPQQHVLSSNGPTPSSRPASSGLAFDPIRGAAAQNASANAHNASLTPVSPQTRMVNRASASPSITSLIDPQPSQPPSASRLPYSNHVAPLSVTSAPISPLPSHTRPSAPPPFSAPSAAIPSQRPPMGSTPVPMDIDVKDDASSRHTPVPSKPVNGSTGTTSQAPTPPAKPQRQPQAPPPLPSGSGLLSGTPFGGTIATQNGENGEKKTPNIWLSFDLKGKNNVTINFAREVQQKYGFAALHPRLAARKERQRQLAAASAALEKTEGGVGTEDDMSLDLSEGESNPEKSSAPDEVSLTAAGLPRQRRRKVEDYDRNDEFIDDTEMAWEQQALMAKDGFFVYSGPLVAEGEKQVVERADGTVKRGRGRGRGGTTRGDGTTGRGSRGGRGGGPGSRGGTTVRKPRVTKADRAMMEQEKAERERMAAAMANRAPAPAPAPAPTPQQQQQQPTFPVTGS